MARLTLRRRLAVAGLAGTLTATALVGMAAQSASAAPAAPPYYLSYYMDTASGSALFDLGCAHGRADYNRPGAQQSVVILEFGATYVSGGVWYSTLYSGPDTRLTTVRDAVKQYGAGYYACTGSDTLSSTTISMATNNSAGTITSAAGAYFADRVDEIGAYFNTFQIHQMYAAGGNDIEIGWSSPTAARNWINGYNSTNNHIYYDTGDAAGCPTTRIPSGGDCGDAVHPEWTAEDVWFKAWGASPAVPVPEIYTTSGSMAKQWKYLSLYGYTVHGSKFNFAASLTQWNACQQVGGCASKGTNNTPAQGWSQLYDQLNSDSRSADTVFYSTDIKWY